MTTQILDRHIESSPSVAGGKPRLSGRRITVQNVAIWHLRMGKSVDEICTEHGLELSEVHAALAYNFDHREEIDRSIAAGEAFVAELRKSSPSVRENKLKAHRGPNGNRPLRMG